MRNLIHILSLLPFLGFSQITGTVGNGTTDDTVALQAWLDSGSMETPVGTEIYKITSTLMIDQSGAQTVDFNGATLLCGTAINNMIYIDKSSGVTTLKNVDMDGHLKARAGVSLKSSFDLDNVDVVDISSSIGIAFGFTVNISDGTNWTIGRIRNSSAINIRSVNDGTIGNNNGTSRGIQWTVSYNLGEFHGLIEDSHFERAIGEDGDVLFYKQSGWNANETDMDLTVNRCVFKYGTRRVAKFQSPNFYAYNSTFEGISTSDPDIGQAYETGGFISLQGGTSGELNDYYISKNIVFDGCTFNGSGFDKRIIQTEFYTDIVVSNSNWNNGTQFRMWRGGGGLCLNGNTFTSGSSIYEVNDSPPFIWLGPVVIADNFDVPENFDQYSDASPPSIGDYECVEFANPNDEPDPTPIATVRPWQLKLNGKTIRLQIGDKKIN